MTLFWQHIKNLKKYFNFFNLFCIYFLCSVTVTFNVNNSVEDEEAPGEYDASKKDDTQDAQVISFFCALESYVIV